MTWHETHLLMDGIIILNSHFISQSFPDIQRKKLKQAEGSLQTP
jgi:hypothetical protein